VQPIVPNGRGTRMPSSAVQTFSDPDDYATAIRATRAELTVIGGGRFTAKLTRIDLHRLWMQRFSDNLPRVAHSAPRTGRAIISFRTAPGPSLLWSGVDMQPTNITRHSEGKNSFQHSSGSACWGAISLPVEDMASVGAAMAGCDLTPPKDALTITPPPAAMAKLQRLHAAAGLLAEDAPAVIAHSEAARGLEQALIEVMVGCLGGAEVREDSAAQRHHAMIMRRFRSAVGENPDQPLYIPELCTAIGVPGRTLRVCCQEQLGMSPKRYLLLRRMHLARRALRESSPTATTVTEIRDAIRLLAIRAVRRRIQFALRGIAVRHARSPARVSSGAPQSIFSSFLPKLNSAAI
jgi:AraC-like DNA-binding protein